MFSRPLFVTLWLLLAAGGMMLLPEDMQGAFRLRVADLVQPGCRLWGKLENWWPAVAATWRAVPEVATPEVDRLRRDLAAALEKTHQLEIQLAQQQESAATHQPPLFSAASASNGDRLTQPMLIEAAVLGKSHATSWRKGRWLDQGKAKGMLEDAPILASSEPLLDLGRDARLSAEDALLRGRTVIGKVHQVGRWTSTFLLVTDPRFRSRAQLVRETPEGYVFGAKGVLKGQGDAHCRLEGIPASDTVEIGNTVYTAERDGVLPSPFYYGRVIEATLDDHAKEWSILVQPLDLESLTKVHVLRTQLNPRRALAN